MEGFLSTFPPYNVCSNLVCTPPPPPGQRGVWAKGEARFVTPHSLNYLELCKALLAQVTIPSPAPPGRRTNTRECGVQVNAKVDKTVQCSLGPKTLLCCPGERDQAGLAKYPEVLWEEGKAPCTPPAQVSNLRFTRPVSIYSPVFEHRFPAKHRDEGEQKHQEAEEEAGEEVEVEVEEEEDDGCQDTEEDNAAVHEPYRGPNFQFLEQRYGFFHCKKCNIRWESAYVWCISGTNKVYYKQLCRKCQVGFNPYRVESIICKGCSQTCCTCEKKQRHINMRRPHRQDLCCRCRGMKLSCDVTYSFKYIV
ncbi:ZAR1-like protein [Dunckerocampus dactyliophorus]|uniref:ZAR1-like protein n=1 Tax=Dunckerocampus dactyliophorus TaxID=161453 RepID=UPI002406FEA5|nr:ZAR1-like protein [Dunckerocampus dactyliophorus]